MNLVEIKDVTLANSPIKFSLNIPEFTRLGLELDNQESKLLLDLLAGKIFPISGSFQTNADVMFKRNDDGLYEQLTVQEYLKLFEELADSKIVLNQIVKTFDLSDQFHLKIANLTVDQKERLHLLRIYLFQPAIVILESPLHKLTNAGSASYLKLISFLRDKGETIVVTASSLDELNHFCNVCYQVQNNHLERVNSVKEKSDLKIVSHNADQTLYFKSSEVDFIESINGISNLFVNGKYYPINNTLNEMAIKLMDNDFFRCHRSYLVNLKQVSEIVNYSKNSYGLILKNKEQTKLPLSRTKLTEIKQLLSTIQP